MHFWKLRRRCEAHHPHHRCRMCTSSPISEWPEKQLLGGNAEDLHVLRKSPCNNSRLLHKSCCCTLKACWAGNELGRHALHNNSTRCTRSHRCTPKGLLLLWYAPKCSRNREPLSSERCSAADMRAHHQNHHTRSCSNSRPLRTSCRCTSRACSVDILPVRHALCNNSSRSSVPHPCTAIGCPPLSSAATGTDRQVLVVVHW